MCNAANFQIVTFDTIIVFITIVFKLSHVFPSWVALDTGYYFYMLPLRNISKSLTLSAASRTSFTIHKFTANTDEYLGPFKFILFLGISTSLKTKVKTWYYSPLKDKDDVFKTFALSRQRLFSEVNQRITHSPLYSRDHKLRLNAYLKILTRSFTSVDRISTKICERRRNEPASAIFSNKITALSKTWVADSLLSKWNAKVGHPQIAIYSLNLTQTFYM